MLNTISQSSTQTCNLGKRVYQLNNAGTRKVWRLESYQERWSFKFYIIMYFIYGIVSVKRDLVHIVKFVIKSL